jgi:hypothetical protein
MNPKSIVRLSNIVGAVSIILLVYWVFVFISIQVFGLKVFRENITETFYISVMAILALMFGALIINIMFNLSRIAEKHNGDEQSSSVTKSKKPMILFGLSFPLIFAFLFAGDYLTAKRKESNLQKAAAGIVAKYEEKLNDIARYRFEKKWIGETAHTLTLLSKTDKHFPTVVVITQDSLDGSDVYLGFNSYYYIEEKDTTLQIHKQNYLLETTQEERDYLNAAFGSGTMDTRFSAHDGRYELYYPYEHNGKRIILYFSDYQRYGKIGSY